MNLVAKRRAGAYWTAPGIRPDHLALAAKESAGNVCSVWSGPRANTRITPRAARPTSLREQCTVGSSQPYPSTCLISGANVVQGGTSVAENDALRLGSENQLHGQNDDQILSPQWNNLPFQPNQPQTSATVQDHQRTEEGPRTSALSQSSTAGEDTGLGDTVMRTVVSSGNDALKLLFQAAQQRDSESSNHATSGFHNPSQSAMEFATPLTAASSHFQSFQASSAVLKVWDAFRFVKMGWFSAEEAVCYMDL